MWRDQERNEGCDARIKVGYLDATASKKYPSTLHEKGKTFYNL